MERLSGSGGESAGRRSGRSRVALITCGVAVLASVWLAAVLLLGADDAERAGKQKRQIQHESTSVEETAASPSQGADSSPEPRYVERGGETPKSERPDEQPERDLPKGGATNEPGGYDPLGTGAAPGDLSSTERGRVERAVAGYVLYAFGYTGADRAEYTSAVNLTVVNPEFYETPGAGAVSAFSESVAEEGTESKARLENFEVEEQNLRGVAGVARFSMEGSEGSGIFEQRLTLAKWGTGWKVRAAERMRRVEE